jgi:iron complex outermembrane receptor protein
MAMARKSSVSEGVNMCSTAMALAMSALALGAGAPVQSAQASISPVEREGLRHDYRIPAGAIETALESFADRSGLHVVFDVRLTDRVRTSGVMGVYSVREGLDRLLSGTGLSYRLSESGRSVSIILAQAARTTMTDAGGEELPPIDIGFEQKRASGVSTAPGFDAARAKEPIYRDPPGQTVTTVDHKFLETTPMQNVQDMLHYSPGVSVAQGTIPRELMPSIRGSGNRLGMTYPFTVRNLMLYEDGFPIVTADGNGRTDMLDPHSFSGLDVYRGPSSALFGNHALGGAMNFRSFTGAQIDGVETGSEFGSFGYINNYLRAGKKFTDRNLGDFDISLFGSDTRGDGYLARGANEFDQGKILATWTPLPSDRLTFKFVVNNSFAEFMNRSSLTQFYTNPYGKSVDCRIAAPAVLPFCNNLYVPANGAFTSPTSGLVNQSVWQLGTHWHVMRDLVGLRYEHDFDDVTTWRTQFTYDYMDYINSTWPPPKVGPAIFGGLGGPVAIRGPSYAFKASTDITSRSGLFGLPATHYLGFFYDDQKANNPLFSQVPNVWNYGAIGGSVGNIESYHSNIGLRAREEIALTPQLTAAIGFSANWNRVTGAYTVQNYAAGGTLRLPTVVGVDNDYWNTEPEASLTYRVSPEWQLRARYATGYGTPNFMFLTNTPTGAGNNTSLKTQTNMGVDLGVDWSPTKTLTISLTGYHEWFRNEILTQANGLVSYQVNAPSSIHRGAEASVDWRPFEGVRLIGAYSYNDQFFTNFWDSLSATVAYDRSGNRIPNVPTHTLTSRAGYDLPDGDLKGLGAFVEYVFKSSYTIDNANLTSIPSYGLVNLNLHYSRAIADSYVKNIEVFFDVKNVFDRTYVAGANVLTNTLVAGTAMQTPAALLSNSTGASIIAGQPRAFIGGVKFKF